MDPPIVYWRDLPTLQPQPGIQGIEDTDMRSPGSARDGGSDHEMFEEVTTAVASFAHQTPANNSAHRVAPPVAPNASAERVRSARAERLAFRRAAGVTTARTLMAATRDASEVRLHEFDRMDKECTDCKAKMWVEERKPGSSKRNPVFETCCHVGEYSTLPLFPNPPPALMQLLEGTDHKAKHYRNFLRAFNSAFGFTSSGASFDRSLANNNAGVYTYRIQGSVYHLMSDGLLPAADQDAGFAQIYIYDTDYQIDRRSEIFPDLDREVIAIIDRELRLCNPYVAQFTRHNVSNLQDESTQEFELQIAQPARGNRQYDVPTGSEVAVLLLGDGDEGRGERNIVLRKRSGGLMYVSQLNGRYDPLHYVLLFPYGHLGWSLALKNETGITANQFYRYHLMVRDQSRVVHLSGRLTQEYVVDAYAKIEEARLIWIRRNQPTLRAHLYQGLLDQIGSDDAGPTGRMIILPPSFTGGPRYMQALYQDAMAIVRKMGKPDLFITMTCNPQWIEITRELLPGQTAKDRFDLCCRVFRMKLQIMLDLIIKKEIFGKVKGRVYVIEFQKRGLPHAHMLWILDDEYKPKTPEDIDRIVCAEIPDAADKELYDCVVAHMIHGPCGPSKPNSPCMKEGVCSKKYPKAFVEETQISSDGYPLYRRRDDGRVIERGSHFLDNRSVVPYNKYLLKTFNCHINVEICSSIQSVKYLYKYVYKGHDRIQARVVSDDDAPTVRDEPQRYLDARYVSASEAFWRICEFNLQKMYPSVYALQVHDENMQSVVCAETTSVEAVLERSGKTTLTEWMRYNREHPQDLRAKTTLYCDFPSFYTWNESTRKWRPRQQMQCIGRVHFVSPRDSNRYYLRLLLHHVPGATSFADLRTVDRRVYDTYQQAAQALGLLQSDAEFDNDLRLAAGAASPHQVRELFAMLLLFCEVSAPEVLLERYMGDLGEDFMFADGVEEVTDSVRMQVLSSIESILFHNGSTLANFPTLPQDVELPPTDSEWGVSQSSDILPAVFEADRLSAMLNAEQRSLYDAVLNAVESNEDPSRLTTPKLFFVDGPGGSGKTFLYSAILAQMKAHRRNVIATATSGIAALLLEGGRTMHSTFKVPIPVNHLSTCHVAPDTKIGRQILTATLIIVDEAPMMHRHTYEAIDRTCRDIMRHKDPRLQDVPFGGKVVVLGGDFRQMLPVIPKAPRSVVVRASLNRSPLWRDIKVFKLKTNVRVAADQVQWSEFLLSVGEGRVDSDVPLPPEVRKVDSVSDLIQEVYGRFEASDTQMTAKTILTPLNDDVARVNDMVLDKFPGEVVEYRSADVIPPGEVANASLYPTEFLNTIDMASLPLHKLRLKIGCVVMLLRNLNTPKGLCNGTRLRVDGFFPTLLRVTIVSQGAFFGTTHFLPRIALYPSQSKLPFSFKRLQFPIRLAFAMTVNKAQGQTLDVVGLYLTKPLFAHGQLYVALSRTRTGPSGIIFCDDGAGANTIENVVYREVF